MPAPTGAYVMRNAVVTIDAVAYANQCATAQLVPDVPTQTYRTLVPDGVVQDVDSPVWTFKLKGLQINISGGLAKALRDATVGDILDVTLAPKNSTGEGQATFQIVAKPVVFGGDQGAFAEIDDEFAVLGQPTFGTVS